MIVVDNDQMSVFFYHDHGNSPGLPRPRGTTGDPALL